MQPNDLIERLRSFALRSKNPTIDIDVFLHSLSEENPDPRNIEEGLRELSFRGELSLSNTGGRLSSVTLPDFPLMALVDEYRRLGLDSSLPFPKVETLVAPIPDEELPSMEAKGELGPLLEACSPAASGAVRLTFPENVPAIVVPRRCVTNLVDAAISRISRFLQEPRDAAFLESKLLGALKGSEAPVRQMLEDITLRPRKAAFYVMSPTEFSFRFWSHLTHNLIADILAQGARSDTDQTLLQCAYLVSYAAFHQKGATEREKERAVDRKSLELLVRKPPYVFSTQAVYSFKDGKGALLSAKHGRAFITSFLEEACAAKEEESLPSLLRVHAAAEKKDYYIQRDFVVPVFLKQVGDAGDRLRVAFVREWVDAMRRDRPPPICKSDPVFRREVDQRVRTEFPLIPALAHAPLLRLASENPSLAIEAKDTLDRCFARDDALRPTYVLLGLSRQRLFSEARSYLPFWQTAPVISGIARFLQRLFQRREEAGGRERSDPRLTTAAASLPGAGRATAAVVAAAPGALAASAAASGRLAAETQDLERLRRVLRALISRYVPQGDSVTRALDELADRWNPLIEAQPKRDLVKDVNALVRDFLRPIRRSLLAHPPDEQRIAALADQLAASRSLAKIVDRDSLLRYLSLYMLQTLLTQ